MLTKLAQYFGQLLNQQNQTTYGSQLEQYIISKCPTSAAEIDHWVRQYSHEQSQRGWL